jgi:cell division transport system permease protein
MNFRSPIDLLRASPSDARLLPEGRMAGPMPWVIAIMMFLTALAAATGLSLSAAATGLDADLAGRLTVQVIEANPEKRDRHMRALTRELGQLAAVETVRALPQAEVTGMLKPWFGDGLVGEDLPVPGLIDVTLKHSSESDMVAVRQSVKAISPTARVDEHAQWLAPLARLLGSLKWVSIMLVLLMAGAMAATVVLVARAALNSHRQTIEVLHLLGASDLQVAALFQRRIALDALLGSAVGLGFALLTLLLLKYQFSALGSDLATGFGPGWLGWILIIVLPMLGAALATVAARITVLSALRRML